MSTVLTYESKIGDIFSTTIPMPKAETFYSKILRVFTKQVFLTVGFYEIVIS